MKILSKTMRKRWGKQVKMNIDHDGTQGLVFVALDGWDKDKYDNREGQKSWSGVINSSKGKQIRLSLNSPLRMTWSEWQRLVKEIEANYVALRDDPERS